MEYVYQKQPLEIKSYQLALEQPSNTHFSVLNMLEDHSGMIWSSSESLGLIKLNPAFNRFKYFEYPLQPNEIAPRFREIEEWNDTLLLLGSSAEGLFQFNRHSGQFLPFKIPSLGTLEEGGINDIPIIMLTAKADFDSKMLGLEHGADAYLPKPFKRKELLLRIKKLLELRKKLQHFYRKQLGIKQPKDIIETSKTIPKLDVIQQAFLKKNKCLV